MGKKIRITRKQLKQDEVASFWADTLRWVQENQKTVLIAVIAAAVLFFFVSAYKRRAANRLADANMYLTAAMDDIQTALMAEKEETRTQRFDDAQSKLDTVLDLYKRSRLAREAVYLLGNIAFYRNDYDEAERLYLRYLDMAKDRTEKAQAYIALGYTFENKFFWEQDSGNRSLLDRAEESFRQAESLTTGTMERYMAMLGRAGLYDLQPSKREAAKALYAQIARERKLQEPAQSKESAMNIYKVMLDRMKNSSRLFSLAQTAQLRLEQLEAEH